MTGGRPAVLALALQLGGVAAFAVPEAVGQTLCGERESFVAHLGRMHREATTGLGITTGGKVLELLTAEDGSWTIIVTAPDGRACLVAAGENWQPVARAAMDPESCGPA